jgi:hypothetical protein
VQPGSFPSTGISLFEWFVIDVRISRAVVRILDGVVAIGIDFAGLTQGDPAGLINLRDQVGDGAVYSAPLTGGRPILMGSGGKQGDGDIDALVNADVMAAIVADVSRQIAGTQVHPLVKIGSIALRPQFFDKPLRGREIGLCAEFVADTSGGDVTGRLFLQAYLATGGATDVWKLYIGDTQIDTPWWVDVATVFVGVALSVLLPLAAPLFAVGVVAVLDGIIPGAISSGETMASAALGSGMTLATGYAKGNLPTHLAQSAWIGTTRIKVNTDGVDVHMVTVAQSVRFGSGDATINTGSITAALEGGSPVPYSFAVILRPDLAALAADCSVQLIVTRADTGAEVARAEGPYPTSRLLSLDHLTPELYFVDAFTLQARIFLNRASLTGLLFASTSTLKVHDELDRSHPFVTWSEHTAYFRSPDDPNLFWQREAVPTLHRTAVSARCLGLRQRTDRMITGALGLSVIYRDELGWEWADMQQHRAEICDFCFFGHPGGNTTSPQEDWFRR